MSEQDQHIAQLMRLARREFAAWGEAREAVIAGADAITRLGPVEASLRQMTEERDSANRAVEQVNAIRNAELGMWRQQSKQLTEARDLLQDLADRLKQEAQIHAQEARTQRATVLECYQAVGAQKGDWNGAQPVREYVERTQQCLTALRASVEALRPYLQHAVTCRLVTAWSKPVVGQSGQILGVSGLTPAERATVACTCGLSAAFATLAAGGQP